MEGPALPEEVPSTVSGKPDRLEAGKLKALQSKPLSLAAGQENSQSGAVWQKAMESKAGYDFLPKPYGHGPGHNASSVLSRDAQCTALRLPGGRQGCGQEARTWGRPPVSGVVEGGGASYQGAL